MIGNPVWRAQCSTWAVAVGLCGINSLREDQGLATSGNHPLSLFRAKRQFRDKRANALRRAVAKIMRQRRRRQ